MNEVKNVVCVFPPLQACTTSNRKPMVMDHDIPYARDAETNATTFQLDIKTKDATEHFGRQEKSEQERVVLDSVSAYIARLTR